MVLVQVSQYTFALCSYKDKKSEPAEMMQLDGFTVDYIEPASGEYNTNIYIFNIKSNFNQIFFKFPAQLMVGMGKCDSIFSSLLDTFSI